MKIKIKKLTITNFKGIKSYEEEFGDVVNIFGDNATGKTTVMDAYTWLLFGKDSEDKAHFSIKPLDKNNEPLGKAESEVEAVLDIDGQTTTLKRSYAEKWVKKRGAKNAVLAGHETSFWFDGVPLSMKDFQAKLDNVIDDQLLKLCSIPGYFQSLPWNVRRDILMALVSGVTDEQVAEGNPDYQELLEVLGTKTAEEYRREIAAQKKKIKKQMDEIPVRIDEIHRSMPEPVDTEAITKEIAEMESRRSKIEESIEDVTARNQDRQGEILDLQNQRSRLITEKDEYIEKIKESFRMVKRGYLELHDSYSATLSAHRREANGIENEISEIAPEIDQLEAKRSELRDKWHEENSREIKLHDLETECPTCKRPFDDGRIEEAKDEMIAAFKADRSEKLEQIRAKGVSINEDIEERLADKKILEQALVDLKSKMDPLIKQLDKLVEPGDPEFSKDQKDQIVDYDVQIVTLKRQIDSLRNKPLEGASDLKEERAVLNKEIDQKKRLLVVDTQIKEAGKRIGDLEAQLDKMAEEYSYLEGREDLVNSFTKAKIELLESRINNRFDYVQFKMYEKQINEGERETCVTLINGVPYEDANTAARINAGIDIINTLGEYYDIQAPIWIDHRESVVNPMETPSQTINLIVSADDKKLRTAS